MIPCAEFPSPNNPDSTGRGRLQLMPQLTLPVEHIETDVEIADVDIGVRPEQPQSEAQHDPRRHRTRAVAYDAPN